MSGLPQSQTIAPAVSGPEASTLAQTLGCSSVDRPSKQAILPERSDLLKEQPIVRATPNELKEISGRDISIVGGLYFRPADITAMLERFNSTPKEQLESYEKVMQQFLVKRNLMKETVGGDGTRVFTTVNANLERNGLIAVEYGMSESSLNHELQHAQFERNPQARCEALARWNAKSGAAQVVAAAWVFAIGNGSSTYADMSPNQKDVKSFTDFLDEVSAREADGSLRIPAPKRVQTLKDLKGEVTRLSVAMELQERTEPVGSIVMGLMPPSRIRDLRIENETLVLELRNRTRLIVTPQDPHAVGNAPLQIELDQTPRRPK